MGGAEVAGRVLQDVLRKLLLDRDISWVEALPHALRIHHDMIDITTGISPYQTMFGRERALAGLPWEPPRECWEAENFFDTMRQMDEDIARLLMEAHEKIAERVNARRQSGTPPQVGEWVWYLRPKEIGGNKLQSWWLGPYKVLDRVGERSYRLRTPQGEVFDAHEDQVKPCVWEDMGTPEATMRFPEGNSE